MLVASGDENELSMLCDRVIVFRDGRIEQELTGRRRPDDIVNAIPSLFDQKSSGSNSGSSASSSSSGSSNPIPQTSTRGS